MKVVVCGALFGSHLCSHMVGWVFEREHGDPAPDTIEFKRTALKVALIHVAEHHGIHLEQPAQQHTVIREVERVPLEIERAAADAIAIARWRGPGL